MKFKMYTTSQCGFCRKAKAWLNERNHTYEEISLDDPVLREQFKQDNPGMRTVPQIYLVNEDGSEHYIGGFTDLSRPHDLLKG